MPKALEEKLFRQGREKGLTGERLNAYVYGTLRNTGWKPSREKDAMSLSKTASEIKHYLKTSGLKDMLMGGMHMSPFDATQYDIERGKRLLGLLAGGSLGAAVGGGIGVGAGSYSDDDGRHLGGMSGLLGLLGAAGGGMLGAAGGSRLMGLQHALKQKGFTGMLGSAMGATPEATVAQDIVSRIPKPIDRTDEILKSIGGLTVLS